MNENLKLSKKSLRLILKRANSNLSPTKIINQLIKNEDEKKPPTYLMIHEKFTNFNWKIIRSTNGVDLFCFANLNDEQNAEYGYVTFKEIDDAFMLSDGGDDNKFEVKLVNS